MLLNKRYLVPLLVIGFDLEIEKKFKKVPEDRFVWTGPV